MTREDFMATFSSVFADEEGWIKFDQQRIMDILDVIEEGFENDKCKLWEWESEVYILWKETGLVINWYKLTHIGRSLFVSDNIDMVDLEDILYAIREEIMEELK